MIPRPPTTTRTYPLFPYTPLFPSQAIGKHLPAFAQSRLVDHRRWCRRRFYRVAVLVVLALLRYVGRLFVLSLLTLGLALFRGTTQIGRAEVLTPVTNTQLL